MVDDFCGISALCMLETNHVAPTTLMSIRMWLFPIIFHQAVSCTGNEKSFPRQNFNINLLPYYEVTVIEVINLLALD